ncbi:hypothetical protein QBC36DRAFT_293118 [Triangularia setosa]|uniref:Uncharacterized protein n=1 Tax=Triangularia setosa TaxID=2587417 RepID=A0AAN7A377_9PEZI|nr:hypothetical protein QBC36DRAFT_293118 [Podospora setosa]
METPIYSLTITISPSSPSHSPPNFILSLPDTLSAAQINSILSSSLHPALPTGERDPEFTSPGPVLDSCSTTITSGQRPIKRLLHLNPTVDLILLANVPDNLSSPKIPLTTLFPDLSKFRRIAIPFDLVLTPESLLSIWPHHLPKLEDIYVLVDTGLHPEVLRRDDRYQPATIETFVCLEGKGYDVHGDSEDRAWVVGMGKGTGDGLVKGLNEEIYKREVWGKVEGQGRYLSPKVGLLGLVRESGGE